MDIQFTDLSKHSTEESLHALAVSVHALVMALHDSGEMEGGAFVIHAGVCAEILENTGNVGAADALRDITKTIGDHLEKLRKSRH